LYFSSILLVSAVTTLACTFYNWSARGAPHVLATHFNF
jgi:hypothetical protein